jgi:hypothetical protein
MKKIEMQALTQLQDIQAQKGMDAQSQFAYEQAAQDATAREQASRAASQEQMQRRGMADSGMAQVQGQMAAQSMADQARMAGMQQASEANKRALEALSMGAGLAGKIGSREQELAMQQAQAQDAINRFNTGQMSQQEMQNWQASNAAKEAFINKTYAAKTGNVDIANRAASANANIPKDIFNMNLSKISGQQPILSSAGQYSTAAAQDSAKTTAAGLQGVMSGIGTAAKYLADEDELSLADGKLKKPKPTSTAQAAYDKGLA